MAEALPLFRYHPNPLATGMVKPSDTVCVCCGQSRGFVYVGPVYSVEELHECLCPWCIADGSAATKLDASFADSHPLVHAGLPAAIVEEVHLRTPAYTSWQQESWLAHCHDACEFHGDALASDVANATPETKAEWMREYNLSEQDWLHITKGYQSSGDPALYKFVCRHCKLVLLGWDCS